MQKINEKLDLLLGHFGLAETLEGGGDG